MEEAVQKPELVLPVVTRNPGKLREITEILTPFGFHCVSAYNLAPLPEIEETGRTYPENALLKARKGYATVRRPCAGEDSGLEVDALDGAPGLYSARFGSHLSSSPDQITLLLSHLKDVPPEDRTARFRAAVALVWEGGEQIFEGICEGWISVAPLGRQGFGYDPVFMFPPYDKTFAELDRSVKNTFSHRGIAFRAMGEFILKHGLLEEWVS